jgi:hypothetical protein
VVAECNPYFWDTIHLFITSGDNNAGTLLTSLSNIQHPTAWSFASEFFGKLIDSLWPDNDTTYFETVNVFAAKMLERTGMVLESVSCHILTEILVNLVQSFQFTSDKQADRFQAVTLNYGAQLVHRGDSADHEGLKIYLGSYYSAAFWPSSKDRVS